ncbi:MAG: macro domain-containing protein [bacterium]
MNGQKYRKSLLKICDEVRLQFGTTSILVVIGDITEQAVDAIVNSANTHMIIGGRKTVSGAIIRKTGGKVLEALRNVERPVELGALVVTKGFTLPSKYVFHVATHGADLEEKRASEDLITLRLSVIGKAIDEIINKSNDLKIKTLAIPLFATGALRFPVGLVIDVILNSLQEKLKEKCTLTQIRIVMLSDDQIRLKALIQAFYSRMDIAANDDTLDTFVDTTETKRLVGDEIKNNLMKFKSQIKGVKQEKLIAETNQRRDQELFDLKRKLLNYQERIRVLIEENRRLKLQLDPNDTSLIPMPVAFAMSMVDAVPTPTIQVENIRKAFSIVAKYFAIIALAEYQEAGAFSQELNKNLSYVFQNNITDGAWLKVTADIARSFTGNKKPCIIKELPSLWFTSKGKYAPLQGSLDKLRRLRNEIHDNFITDETSAKKWLEDALPVWNRILELSKPLHDYKLVFIEKLEDFSDQDPDSHRYLVRWLMGEYFYPRTEFVDWKPRLRKGCLYLKAPNEERFLPLSPFMLYEHCTITKSRESCYLDKFNGETVSFATFRFPYRWQDNSFSQEIRALMNPTK